MRTVNWQQREITSVEDICPAIIDAVLAAEENADSEINFDLSEPWDEPFDPTDDDPE